MPLELPVSDTTVINGTAHFKNVDNSLDDNIYPYLETSGGESSNLYSKIVQC